MRDLHGRLPRLARDAPFPGTEAGGAGGAAFPIGRRSLRGRLDRALHGLPALELLRMVPGLDVGLIEAECCGLGGLYGFKKEKFAIAEEIGKDLAEAVARMKPDIILTDCEGCRMQIRHLTGLKVLHPVQLLRDALERREIR